MIVLYAGAIAEEGLTTEVIGSPQTPLHATADVLSARPAPRADGLEGDDLGEPPKVINPGPGCRFAPRCPLAMDQCVVTTPPMVALSATHHAACYAVKP